MGTPPKFNSNSAAEKWPSNPTRKENVFQPPTIFSGAIVDGSEILRSPVDVVVDIPLFTGYLYIPTVGVLLLFFRGVLNPFWHFQRILVTSTNPAAKVMNKKASETPRSDTPPKTDEWPPIKVGTISMGNTSEPTIHFQGTFVSFPGSTPKNTHFVWTKPNWFTHRLLQIHVLHRAEKTPSKRKNCCSKNHIRHILRSWF